MTDSGNIEEKLHYQDQEFEDQELLYIIHVKYLDWKNFF